MAHNTLIDGTAYEVSGGRTLVDGTGYDISKGKTLVDGTGYEISFGKTIPVVIVGETKSSYGYAKIAGVMYYSDAVLTVLVGDTITLAARGASGQQPGRVYINGNKAATSSGTIVLYDWVVPDSANSVTIEFEYKNSTGKYLCNTYVTTS